MQLADRVLRTVRKHGMIPPGGRVLVALSGGPDSVALTLLLRALEHIGEWRVAGVAHVNHQLREAAAADEAFCGDLARRLSLPLMTERVDVRGHALRLRVSLEDAGRRARYAFFDRAAEELGADVVATGHTRDDQAETFLLRLLRGAGPRGLAGVFPVAGRVVRPLLEIRRPELIAYLVARGQPYCEDPSNLDLSIPRNRVRHELIPYLQREHSPGIVDVLAREAELARQDEDRLAHEAIESVSSVVLSKDSGCREGVSGPAVRLELDVRALGALHPAVASRVARHALALASGRFIGFEHVQRFLEFVRAGRPREISLPGCRAVYRGDRIELGGKPSRPFSNSFRIPLSVPGEVTLAAQGWAISAQPGEALPDMASEQHGWTRSVAVQADGLALPLAVRSRRPGDRFSPPGLGGRRRKLQDVLVDRKIPRERRDSLPLVVDNGDRIVWIVGEALSEDFRVTDPARGVILLKARRLGGEG